MLLDFNPVLMKCNFQGYIKGNTRCKGPYLANVGPGSCVQKGRRAQDERSFLLFPLPTPEHLPHHPRWRAALSCAPRAFFRWTIFYWSFFSLSYSSKVSKESCGERRLLHPLPYNHKVCSALPFLEPSDLTWLKISWAGGKSCCHLQVSFTAHSQNQHFWANLSVFRDSWMPMGLAEQ